MDFLQPAYMETVISTLDKQNKMATPILNMFFGIQKGITEETVKVPKETNSYDDLLPLIERGAAIPASSINANKGYFNYTLRTFGDLKILKPEQIKKYKQQLANLTGQTYAQKKIEIVNEIIGEFNRKVNATREFMAGSALTGTIKDKDGNTLETFDIPADNKLGTVQISNGNTKVYKLIMAMFKQLRKATNYRGRVGFILGEGAYEKILDTEEYQAWASNPANALSASDIVDGVEGYLGTKRTPFLTADGTYYQQGEAKTFFDTDTIALAPIGVFREYYTTIETNDGSFSKLKHIDNFKTYNPDGTAYRLQTASMPIVTLPNGIVTAKLS